MATRSEGEGQCRELLQICEDAGFRVGGCGRTGVYDRRPTSVVG
jgi:hypothetical protein